MVFLKFPQLKSTWPWSLSNLAAWLRFNLLTYRDLWSWLNARFERPAITPVPAQATLFAVILDSSRGNLIGGSAQKSSHTQDLRREEPTEQIILDSSDTDQFLRP